MRKPREDDFTGPLRRLPDEVDAGTEHNKACLLLAMAEATTAGAANEVIARQQAIDSLAGGDTQCRCRTNRP